MAMQLDLKELDFREQSVRIRRAIQESDKLSPRRRSSLPTCRSAGPMGAGAALAKLFVA